MFVNKLIYIQKINKNQTKGVGMIVIKERMSHEKGKFNTNML